MADPTSSSALVVPATSSIEEFRDNGHTFDKVPDDQLPKHKIFISHSGEQKDFAAQLCRDLDRWGYFAFFDQCSHSLPKGENFPRLIFEAARECFLAIVLLSKEFFTRTKWPMLELATFVEAQKSRKFLRILPVLLNICTEDLKDIQRWSDHWQRWVEKDRRLNWQVIEEWKNAIKSIRPLNMLMQSSYEGEVALREAIVQAVVEMMPPDIQPNVAHVQGKERLYKQIASKFSSIPPSCSTLCKDAKVIGVYGIAGAGKSTLCMILTHFLRGVFQGKVYHVELDKEVSIEELQRQALQHLTGADHNFLNRYINCKEKGSTCLMRRIPRQRVFLALDSVSDIEKSVEIAKMFLAPRFHLDSLVLVTSRSKDVLHTRLGIPESCCMPCPQVNAEEALKIVLNHCQISSTENLAKEQKCLLQQTVDSCNFEGFGGFHPLSLRVLASQMGCDPCSWKPGDIQEASDIEHPLFSVIETNFSRLPDQQTRDIFMDIALFRPESVNTVHDICIWLDDTLEDIKSTEAKLCNLRMKSLLEFWSSDADTVRIHSLHHELAKRNARVEGISRANAPRFVYQKGGKAIAAVFSSRLAKHIERAGFVECSFTAARFEQCSYLKRLCIRRCKKLETLSLNGVMSLASLELTGCQLKNLKLNSVVNLRWLSIDSCGELPELDACGLKDLTHVWLWRCSDLETLKLADCHNLKSLSVSYNASLMDVDLGSGQSLHSLTLWFCEELKYVHLSMSTKGLSKFKKRGCPKLLNVQGHLDVCDDVKCLIVTRWQNIPGGVITSLTKSRHLQVLDLWDCPVSRLPDLRSCADLLELRLSDLDVLLNSADRALWKEYAAILTADIESLQLPVSLEDVRIASCRNVVVKEVCWKLQGLKNLTVLSMQRVRVAWDWEMYMPIEQKASNFHACHKTSSMSEAQIPIKAPLTDIGWEAEMLSGDEVEFSSEEANSDNGDLSVEGASSDNADVWIDGDSLNKEDGFSEGLHQGVGFEIFSYVCQIFQWVQAYLEIMADDSPLEREVNETLQFYMREKNMVKLSIADSENDGLSWERMFITCGRIRNLQFGIIEQTLLETCDNCDTVCEQICKRQSVEWLGHPEESLLERFQMASVRQSERPESVMKVVEKIQLVSTQELKAQLDVLEAISPQGILEHDDLETWEGEIMHELAFCEKVRSSQKSVMWENRLQGEGIHLRLPRVEALRHRLANLIKCRNWDARIDAAKSMKKRRGDCLLSCKICILIEQLLGLVERQGTGVMDKDGGSPSDFQWLREAVEKIDLLLGSELDNICSLNLSVVEDFRVRGMLRGWKTRQWLQMVVSGLLQDFVAGDVKPEIIKPEYILLLHPHDSPEIVNRFALREKLEYLFAKMGGQELSRSCEFYLETISSEIAKWATEKTVGRIVSKFLNLNADGIERDLDLKQDSLLWEVFESREAERRAHEFKDLDSRSSCSFEETLHFFQEKLQASRLRYLRSCLQLLLKREIAGDKEMHDIRNWLRKLLDESSRYIDEDEELKINLAAETLDHLLEKLRRHLKDTEIYYSLRDHKAVTRWERVVEVASELVAFLGDCKSEGRYVPELLERDIKAMCEKIQKFWDCIRKLNRGELLPLASSATANRQEILSTIGKLQEIRMPVFIRESLERMKLAILSTPGELQEDEMRWGMWWGRLSSTLSSLCIKGLQIIRKMHGNYLMATIGKLQEIRMPVFIWESLERMKLAILSTPGELQEDETRWGMWWERLSSTLSFLCIIESHKLIKGLQIIRKMHGNYLMATNQERWGAFFNHDLLYETTDVDWARVEKGANRWGAFFNHGLLYETTDVDWARVEKVGIMGTFLMPRDDPQPGNISLEVDVRSMWRRAETFPLRQQWNNINRDHNFTLPITNCSRFYHVHVSDC